jgi:lysozyme
MLKIITSCVCAAIIVWGAVVLDPVANSLQAYEKQFEWVAESTIELVTHFEGKRHKAYQDIGGKWTIGVGHLIRPQDRHLLHTELSEEQVMGILHLDLKKCSEALESSLKVPVNRPQSDALHSLCHNIGPDRMVRSEVVQHLNNGDVQRAADAFMNWTRPGLTKRRQAEKQIFLAAE